MSVCDDIVGSLERDGSPPQRAVAQAVAERSCPPRLSFQPDTLELYMSAVSQEYVDSCFDSWSRFRVGASARLPRLWRLFPMGKAAHLIAKRMLQPGDVCFRVSHRSIKANDSFRPRYVHAIDEFSALACANLRVRRDVHNCETYTVVESA